VLVYLGRDGLVLPSGIEVLPFASFAAELEAGRLFPE
jgi:hypothetical protein